MVSERDEEERTAERQSAELSSDVFVSLSSLLPKLEELAESSAWEDAELECDRFFARYFPGVRVSLELDGPDSERGRFIEAPEIATLPQVFWSEAVNIGSRQGQLILEREEGVLKTGTRPLDDSREGLLLGHRSLEGVAKMIAASMERGIASGRRNLELREFYLNAPIPLALLDEMGNMTASPALEHLIRRTEVNASELLGIESMRLRGYIAEVKIEKRVDLHVSLAGVEGLEATLVRSGIPGFVLLLPDIGRMVAERDNRYEQVEKLATVGRFTAGIVHELNNPLTSIRVYSDYLLKRHEELGLESADRNRVARIHEGAERILKFTQDLMAYTRPSRHEASLHDASKLVREAVGFCQHVINERGIMMHTALVEGIRIIGVRQHFHQMLVNLITNAAHAVPEDAGELIVRMEMNEGELEISVADNGPGIPDEIRDRIFEPFFSTKGEGKGTGLGLAIVANLVSRHRGRIRIDTEVGQGTRFVLSFPLTSQD